ncbi:MAG: hypothetical protein ACE5H3_05775 [Planctomycetota bacterium]
MTFLRVPDGGVQPQALADARGNVHLIYFRGERAGAGDLFYVRRERGNQRFSDPIRVNSRADSAIATGTVRGGQIALGEAGRVHVCWNGAGGGSPKAMFYSRMNDAGTAFEEQRNLMQVSAGLDGGGTVAADSGGNVYVAWHAVKKGERGEEKQKVWVARSTDEGLTFAKETPAWKKPTGACSCCSMRALASARSVAILYRSATNGVNRDIYLLASRDKGASFRGTLLHKWKLAACPMSTMALAEGPGMLVAAWETEGQIFFARIDPDSMIPSMTRRAPGAGGGRKHPALAFNARRDMILVWTEGTGWQRGGALAWQVFDKAGLPTDVRGRVEGGIPAWGLPAVVETEGGFTIIH